MTSPVPQEEEVFVVKPGQAKKSRYDFEGECDVEITDIVAGESKSGNPKYIVTLVGLDGPAEGLTFTDHQPEYKLRAMLKVLGDTTPDEAELRFKKSATVGQKLTAKFVSEEFNGKRSAKVREYLSAKSGGVMPF